MDNIDWTHEIQKKKKEKDMEFGGVGGEGGGGIWLEYFIYMHGFLEK